MSLADLKVRISTNADAFDSGFKKMQKSFDRQVRKMERTGKRLTQNITLPLAALAGAATKAAIDFEDAFAGVEKTVDGTAKQMAGLRTGILNLSKVMPTSAGEIAKVAEAAGQLGIQTDSILDFSKVMVMLGDTTNLSADVAATSLARIANVMQIPQDRFDEMGSTIVDLGNKFATTEAEIVEMATRMAAAGNITNMTSADVFALSTALSSVGVRAESGGTAMQKALLNINDAVASGNDNLQVFADTAGMTSDQFAIAWKEDAANAFNEFIKGLGKSGDNATTILSDVGLNSERVRTAILSLANAGELLSDSLDTSEKAWSANNALTEEAQKKYEKVASRLKMLWNRIYALGVSFGDALLPVINKGVDFVERFTEAFEGMGRKAKIQIMAVAGLLAASGPLIIGMVGVIKTVQTLSAIVFSKFTAMTVAVSGLVVAGQWMSDNWETIKNRIEEVTLSIELAFLHMARGIQKAVMGTIEFLVNAAPPSILANVFGIDMGELTTDMLGLEKGLDNLNKMIGEKTLELSGAIADNKNVQFTGLAESAENAWINVKNTIVASLQGLLDDSKINQLLKELEEKFANATGGGGGFSFGAGQSSGSRATRGPSNEGTFLDPVVSSEMQRIDNYMRNLVSFDFGGKIQQQTEQMSAGLQVATDLANTFTNSFGQGMANVIVQGEKLQDVLKNIGRLLVSSAIQKGISLLLTGGLSGVSGFFGDGGGLFGKIFGRDIGGPAFANQPYLIGKGPHQEMFVPQRSGTIIPNSKLRGSGRGGSQRIIVETPVYLDRREIYRGVKEYEYKLQR